MLNIGLIPGSFSAASESKNTELLRVPTAVPQLLVQFQNIHFNENSPAHQLDIKTPSHFTSKLYGSFLHTQTKTNHKHSFSKYQ